MGKAFIKATTDKFSSATKTVGESSNLSGLNVRRPLRGIVLKKDSYASISVIDESGNFVQLTNESSRGSSPTSDKTSNFILQTVNESRAERTQIVQTFGDSYYYFYGEMPLTINCQGILLNTADFQWSAEFLHNYDTYLRGTALVKHRRRAILEWDEELVSGYFININVSENSQMRNVKTLNFSFLVTDRLSKHTFTQSFPISATPSPSILQFENLGSRNIYTTEELGVNRAKIMEAYAKANVEKYKGVVGAIREGVDGVKSVIGMVNSALDKAKNFLFGDTLIIPEGYAASDYLTGQAEFVAGTIAYNELLNFGTFGDNRTPALTFKVTKPEDTYIGQRPYGKFMDNTDEYIDKDDEADVVVINEMGKLQKVEDDYAKIEKHAKDMMKKFGIDPDANHSADRLLAGKLAFAAVGVGAQVATAKLGRRL